MSHCLGYASEHGQCSIFELILNGGIDAVACAFEGLDNIDLEALR